MSPTSSGHPPPQNPWAWMSCLYDDVVPWLSDDPDAPARPETLALAGLVFAYGLLRLGDDDAATELQHHARATLSGRTVAHDWLLRAHEYRLEQARKGHPASGPLPAGLLDELQSLEDRVPRYAIDRYRASSRLVDPEPAAAASHTYPVRIDPVELEIRGLAQRSGAELLAGVREAWKKAKAGHVSLRRRNQVRVLRFAAGRALEQGEELAHEVLTLAGEVDFFDPAIDFPDELREQIQALTDTLLAAAHFAPNALPGLGARLQRLGRVRPEMLGALARYLGEECLPRLARGGLPDLADRMADTIFHALLPSRAPHELDPNVPGQHARFLELLQVGTAWLDVGRLDRAAPLLETAWGWLGREGMPARSRCKLACALADALGFAPLGLAQAGLEGLFRRARGLRDQYTTRVYYGLAELLLIESAVLAGVRACTRPAL